MHEACCQVAGPGEWRVLRGDGGAVVKNSSPFVLKSQHGLGGGVRWRKMARARSPCDGPGLGWDATIRGFVLLPERRICESAAMPAPATSPSAKRLPIDWGAHGRYWRVQILGWLTIQLCLFVQDLLDARARSGVATRLLVLVYCAVCGIASTHALRGWLRWTGNVIGPWTRLAGYGVAGVWAAGVLMAVGVLALPLLAPSLRAEIWTDCPIPAFGAQAFLCMMLCAGWVLLYLGYQSGCRYQESLVERARYEAALKDAELRALRGQLNPHFLFNALNVVRRLAATDPSRTRQAITQLAGLLRDTLNGSEEPAIKLSAELRQVDAYLQLEKLRFEERLQLEWRVPPEAMARPVPPFSVLTLVENAMKHGISARIAGGRLEVEAALADDVTTIRVLNTGTLPDDPRTGRVGMQNLRERLRLLYGDKATLELRAADAERVVAELRVPAAWPESGLTSPPGPDATVAATTTP